MATPFIVTSGYRCPDYNEKISTTGRDGPHTTGRALDVRVDPERVMELITWLYNVNILNPMLHGGLGLRQRGNYADRFVHFDNLTQDESPRPRVWTYDTRTD